MPIQRSPSIATTITRDSSAAQLAQSSSGRACASS